VSLITIARARANYQSNI